tara:strand:+ start:2254 stop:3036 length:783 start_codon:yes stop_codon:yes gene_type:complete
MNQRKIFNSIFVPGIFNQRKFLVTGATSGIGEETSKVLSELGAKLILVGRDISKLENLKKIIGEKHFFIQLDLSEDDSIYKTIKSLPADLLPLDGAFHSSGSEFIKPLNIIKAKDLYNSISNSSAVALSIGRAAANKKCFKDSSSIVFMSSISSKFGAEGMTVYSSSKGCIDSMVKSMSIELSKRKIRFNSINAAAVETPMHKKVIKNMSKEAILNYEKKHPLGFGSTKDISNLVVFLLSDASSWITGTSVIIDGGYSAV